MRVEIRCCCDPGLLIGTVEVDVPSLYEGQLIHLHVPPTISLKPSWDQRDGDLFIEHKAERLVLPVSRVQGHVLRSGEYLNGLAIKSNDTPIEKFRRMRTFREAK